MKIQLFCSLIFAYMIAPFILKTYAFSIDMIPIDSPQLQMLPENFSALERHQFLTSISLSRAYDRRASNTTLKPDSFAMAPYRTRGYYASSLDIGKIAGGGTYTAYVVLDTGSSSTWIQCEGCEPCFEFDGTKFDYRQSETYERIGVRDRLCNPREEYRGSCGFTRTYGSHVRSGQAKGMVGKDTFFFSNPKEQKTEAFPGIAFGCGFENSGFDERSFVGPKNKISGLHGLLPLWRSSFLVQLDHQIKGRFSYCLPAWFRNVRSTTMYFGDDAQIKGDQTRLVQAVTLLTTDHFFVLMTGISVDVNRLPIDPSIFSPQMANSGVIIDSASPYTVLVKPAFDPFHDAIVKYFSEKFGLEPMPHDPTKLAFKVCYETYPTDEHVYPTVIFHFKQFGQTDEVNMVFPVHNVFTKMNYGDTSKVVMCLAVLDAPNNGPSLFGAFQQVDFRILYDIYNELLYFMPEICVTTDD